MEPKAWVGLLVDMQEKPIEDIGGRCDLVVPQDRMLSLLALAGVPLIYTEHRPVLYGHVIVGYPKPSVLLTKEDNDVFASGELDTMLSESVNIVLMGMSARYCVKETVTSALARGHRIHTSFDMIGTAHLENRNRLQLYCDSWTTAWARKRPRERLGTGSTYLSLSDILFYHMNTSVERTAGRLVDKVTSELCAYKL